MAAGAIRLGKTTMPEFAWKAMTDSPLQGVTRNPWNLDHTPGGSTGGGSAQVAAGLGPIAMGTDGGGSIRHSRLLHRHLWHQADVRTRAVLSGARVRCPVPRRTPGADGGRRGAGAGGGGRAPCRRPAVPGGAAGRLRGPTRQRHQGSQGGVELRPRVCPRRSRGHRGDHGSGACLRGPRLPRGRGGSRIWRRHRVLPHHHPGRRGGVLADLLPKWEKDMDPGLVNMARAGMDIPATDFARAQVERHRFYDRVRRFFETYDLLLTPTVAVPPFKAGAPSPKPEHGKGEDWIEWAPFSFPFNLTQCRRPRCRRGSPRPASHRPADRRAALRRAHGAAGLRRLRGGAALGRQAAANLNRHLMGKGPVLTPFKRPG